MRYRYYTVDVFTDRAFGGNQLAVIPNAEGISDEHMQLVAREFNFSETVFVLPAEKPDHTRRVRIFTPVAEVPFAGHPTIGTAFVLAAIGEVRLNRDETDVVLEEGVGPVRVRIVAGRDGPASARLSAAQRPEYGPEPPAAADLAAMLSLETSDLGVEDMPPRSLSCGMPFLLAPLASIDAVRRASLRPDLWREHLADAWARNIYLFSRETERSASDVHARMFAPASGIGEDPATGSAAVALAGYLADRSPNRDGTLRWVVEQGFEMGRPSIIEIEADKSDGEVTALRAGGSAVMMCEGTIELPRGS